MVGRLANLLNSAVTTQVAKKVEPLPKIIVIVPDEDILKCLDYNTADSDLAKAYKRLINYVMTEFERGVSSFKDNLPAKCKKDGYPHFLWILAPLHKKLSDENYNARITFNQCVEDTCKFHVNVSSLELKKVWDPQDGTLIQREKFTAEGYKKYWDAIDRTVRYCDSVVIKKKSTKKLIKQKEFFKGTASNFDQNDKYKWRNPKISKDLTKFRSQRRLPSPPPRRY